jgi:hypothetical protein
MYDCVVCYDMTQDARPPAHQLLVAAIQLYVKHAYLLGLVVT